MDAPSRGADTILRVFDGYHAAFRAVTRRARERFESADWAGIREDAVERLGLYGRRVSEALEALRRQQGDELAARPVWRRMRDAYTHAILGRDDFELAETFFNSVARQVFPNAGADPGIFYVGMDFPVPFKGWEMACARVYAVRRLDSVVLRKVLEDAGFRRPFRDIDEDTRLAAERVEQGLREQLGGAEIEAVDVLRPIFYRNKGAYLVGRVRRGDSVLPLVLAVLNTQDGLEVDAVLTTEDDTSVVFSFARWYFHVDLETPRHAIGFLHSVLPRKRIAELYISLGYSKHGKTEFYRDLAQHIAGTDEKFVVAAGQPGLVMAVFTVPSYEFVFKVIKDRFPPQKVTSRGDIMARYRLVLMHDRVGRLVDFQEFEHLVFPRARFSEDLLGELLEVAGRSVKVRGDDVVIRHAYVERRVTPLDLYLREQPGEVATGAVLDYGNALRDLVAANIFPGDLLLKNFGVTRHGRVVFYDYDELCPLTECNFRAMPPPRSIEDELSSEPWFGVRENDVFPEELGRFMSFTAEQREVFVREHGELFDVDYWRRMQASNLEGEMLDFFPYGEGRRLRPRSSGS